MSLSKEALELIQENAVAAARITLPALGEVAVVPQNFNAVSYTHLTLPTTPYV